jgi:hypothetical protein
MKRSRRVILTMMGTAAIGAVSAGFARRPYDCGPGLVAVPGPNGRPYCRPSGGFGGGPHRLFGHGHVHGGG